MMKKGTYAGVKLSVSSDKLLTDFLRKEDIQNPVPSNKLHVTLLYSRKYLPDYEPAGVYDKPLIATPLGFEIWKSQSGKNCLVLKLSCQKLVDRHRELMTEHNATFDYDEYTPHVTLSYDVGDRQITGKDTLKFSYPLTIVSEYIEDLDLDWADNNLNK